MRNPFRQLLLAYDQLIAWLSAGLVWLLVPLFMLANIALFCSAVPTSPLWAVGMLAAGQAIGVTVLWVTTWAFKCSRRAAREMT